MQHFAPELMRDLIRDRVLFSWPENLISELEATIFPHAEKSTGHLAAQLMAGNKVAKTFHYFMCEYPHDIPRL